jgi:hypothetical protein
MPSPHRPWQRLSAALLLCLTLGAGLTAATLDRLTLKDGRVVAGTIVAEDGAQVTLRSQGASRKYGRDFIKRIQYGDGAEAQAPTTRPVLAPPPPAPAASLDLDLAQRYSVPVSEVQWVRHQGIADADLPMVFFVAASASVLPGQVVDLRLQGWAWDAIERHFGMEPKRVYFVPGPFLPVPLLRASILWPFWLLGALTHFHR